jgi:hypothetical protein
VLSGDHLAERPLPHEVPKAEQPDGDDGRWVEARDLKSGDVLMDGEVDGMTITALRTDNEKVDVHSLDVEGHHNFAVHRKGVLVHNKGAKEAPPVPVRFLADHPFLFLVRENVTGSILFMGRLGNPLLEN